MGPPEAWGPWARARRAHWIRRHWSLAAHVRHPEYVTCSTSILSGCVDQHRGRTHSRGGRIVSRGPRPVGPRRSRGFLGRWLRAPSPPDRNLGEAILCSPSAGPGRSAGANTFFKNNFDLYIDDHWRLQFLLLICVYCKIWGQLALASQCQI